MTGIEIMAAGAILQAGSTVYQGVKSAKAHRKQSVLLGEQADEMLARQAINEQLMRDNEALQESYYVAAQGGTGLEGGAGGVLRMRNTLEQNIVLSRREAEFKARQLRAGAQIESGLASDAMASSIISGIGTLGQAAGKYAQLKAGPNTNTTDVIQVK